ncbi:MAG: metal ABC transporter substrate-binding protein [Bacilli bacterium]|nr:metal ABC transporter substrate-binding protein [Bacilli bacterium]
MKKNIFKFTALFTLILLTTTGCFKRDTLEDIDIIATDYPIEFIVNQLYGEHSNISSIYPDGTNTNNYKLTSKLISDYSKKDLFIYNGLGKDRDIASNFLSKNKNMLIIDSSYGMEVSYENYELWLNPSNLLMMSQNVKNGLEEYLTNNFLEKNIDKKYDELKIKLSELDAEIKLAIENGNRNTIIVNSDSLKFLEKYGLNVISIDSSNQQLSDKVLTTVKEYISNGNVKYVFLLENYENSETVNSLIKETNATTLTFRNLSNITDEERESDIDYFDIMRENIDTLKKELYD